MIKSRFSYLKLTAAVAVLAIAIIGLGGRLSRTAVAREKGTTTPREIASTLEEKSSERAATLLATTGDTTTPTLPTTLSCNLPMEGVQITAINKIPEGVGNETAAIGVAWNYHTPQELNTTVGICVLLDHFDVQLRWTLKNGSDGDRSQKVNPLARTAAFGFTPGLRDVKTVVAVVKAQYTFTGVSSHDLRKDF